FYQDNNQIKGYIIPINTRGLWGKIYGYLAFENDGQTVSGFSVFSHSETPGLGGEIESAWFQKNFKGKKILNSKNKFVSVGIAKGKAQNLPRDLQDNYVDGISGATLTGKYLSQGIKETLVKYDSVSVTFRQKQLKAIKDKQ
ncbi:MAG: FMN-binding protein, partial [Proteobacteria bacterium]|nr:FMN-binding protein [Pseudomonadota bacterium]